MELVKDILKRLSISFSSLTDVEFICNYLKTSNTNHIHVDIHPKCEEDEIGLQLNSF